MKPVNCPSCKKLVAPDEKTFPFCSARCRLIDLGNWLDGKYRVGGDSIVHADGGKGSEDED